LTQFSSFFLLSLQTQLFSSTYHLALSAKRKKKVLVNLPLLPSAKSQIPNGSVCQSFEVLNLFFSIESTFKWLNKQSDYIMQVQQSQ